MTILLLLDTHHSSQQEQSVKLVKIVTLRTTRGGRRVPSARVESTTVASAVSIPRNHGLINYKDSKSFACGVVKNTGRKISRQCEPRGR
jgi:hypothetical protein